MNVVWLFLAVSWVCLQFGNVVFPDHTRLLFLALYLLDLALNNWNELFSLVADMFLFYKRDICYKRYFTLSISLSLSFFSLSLARSLARSLSLTIIMLILLKCSALI